LRLCRESLPVHATKLLEMHYGEAMDASAIAKQMDKTVTSVRMSLSRIRALLRRCIVERQANERLT
jgi:DNA-directed RNA polymerase specialized sigma24 family protein